MVDPEDRVGDRAVEARPFVVRDGSVRRTGWRRLWELAGLTMVPPAVFLWLATTHLEGQGLYYDELHQAVGAFAYVGSPSPHFSRVIVHGIPVFNMYYSGAIKTAVYGVYLRFARAEFAVRSWRLLGILLVCTGIGAFALLAHSRLPPIPLAVVLWLLLTDGTVLLAARHDWGPVALALALRLALIGVWLRGGSVEQPSVTSSCVLGALLGASVFEKLSSIVLAPVVGMMLLSSRRRTVGHALAAIAGGVMGAAPLVIVNVAWIAREGRLFSLTDMGRRGRSDLGPLRFAWEFVSLGGGEQVRQFILGSDVPFIVKAVEPWLVSAALVFAAWMAISSRSEASARVALMAICAYAMVGLGLYALPRETWVHHRVIGTPFQYVAVGAAVELLRRTRQGVRGRLFGIVLAALLAVRVMGVASLEQALWRGETALAWDPSLTQIGVFAAHHAADGVFVAADWGVATQIYCLSNGRSGLVHEVFWSYQGPQSILRLQERSRKTVVYAVSLTPPSNVRPDVTARIFRDLEVSRDWRETGVEPEAGVFRAVTVRKFLRAS